MNQNLRLAAGSDLAARGRENEVPRVLVQVVIALALSACSTPPRELPAETPTDVTRRPRNETVADSPEERFERTQAERAGHAFRQGRLAEAALAWETLTVLRPDVEAYRERLTETRQHIDKGIAQRSSRAQAAQQRGDLAAAEKLWLELLALDPQHSEAAQALREIERLRNRTSVVGRFANPPGLQPRAGSAAAAPSVAGSRPSDRTASVPGQRNQIEHAAMLARQGEIDAAISMLSEIANSGSLDASSRALLVNLHLQRADSTAGKDPAAAIADLERALQLNPRHDAARSRLQNLKRAPR